MSYCVSHSALLAVEWAKGIGVTSAPSSSIANFASAIS
jgi:hypothetical protein